MARFILARSVTIPAGTQIATPASADISFPEYEVEIIQWVIPPGPNGLVGFRIANAGVPVIPYGSNDWIVGNNEAPAWPLSGQITSGSWQVIGYNLGQYDHTIQFRFAVSPVRAAQVDLTASPADLSGLTGGAAAGPTSSVTAVTPAPPPPPILANPPPAGAFVGPAPPPPPGA